MHVPDNCLLPILQQSLIKKANRWLYTIEHKIKSCNDFQKVFRERYWNEPIKSALRARFEMDQWNSE